MSFLTPFPFLSRVAYINQGLAQMFIYVYRDTGNDLSGVRSKSHLADFEIGSFVKKIVMGVVLILVYVALLGPLTTALGNWAKNETTFGPIAQTVVPLLIGVGILLAFIFAFVPSAREKLGYH